MASRRPTPRDSRRFSGHEGDVRRFKQLRFRQLRSFVELSTLGSFAAVAEKLELSVPSVWQQVRALENAFGCNLVHAEGRRLVFTDRGRLLLSMAAPLVKGFDELVETFSQPPEATLKTMSVAAPGEILTHHFPPVLERYRRMHPGVDVRLYERGSAEAVAVVETGAADLAVAGHLDEAPPPALNCEPLDEYRFFFVCRRDHPLADASRRSLRQIVRHPLVVFAPGTNNRIRLDAVIAAAGLGDDLAIAMEASSKMLLLNYVQMGFGASVTSMSRAMTAAVSAGQGGNALVCHDVSRIFGHEQIGLFTRRARYQPPHEKAFCDLLLEVFAGT